MVGRRGEKDTKKLFHNYDGLSSVSSFILSSLTTTFPPPVLIHFIDFCGINPVLDFSRGFKPVLGFNSRFQSRC